MKRKKVIAVVLALVASLAILLALPMKISIGKKTFSKSLYCLHGDHSMWPDFYNRTGWDGPTGSLLYCGTYAIRIGDWLFQFDVVTDNFHGYNKS